MSIKKKVMMTPNDNINKQTFFSSVKELLVPPQQGYTILQKLIFIIIVIVLIILLSMAVRWLIHSPKKTQRPQTSVVVAQPAITADVPVYLNALGQVTPTDTVTVKTQVNGQLQKVFFKEGQMVKAGNVLAQIDERPFQALLTQYQGQLAHDLALLANARLDLQRYELLWKEDSVAKQILDTQRSLVSQLEGTVMSDQGLVDTAKVNLVFCRITSPINGRVGLRLVDPGNFVQTSDTSGLFVINNVRPITVIFTLPEDNIPEVIKQIKTGKKLICEAFDRSFTKKLATGILLTIDNQIDPTTGTVKLKAQFKNVDDSLFPSQFVNIKLKLTELKQAVIILTPAIIHGAKGDIVYKLNVDSKTVKSVPIVAGMATGDHTVIKTGVAVGDVIITEGTDKLKDGASVIVSNQGSNAQQNTKISASSKSN